MEKLSSFAQSDVKFFTGYTQLFDPVQYIWLFLLIILSVLLGAVPILNIIIWIMTVRVIYYIAVYYLYDKRIVKATQLTKRISRYQKKFYMDIPLAGTTLYFKYPKFTKKIIRETLPWSVLDTMHRIEIAVGRDRDIPFLILGYVILPAVSIFFYCILHCLNFGNVRLIRISSRSISENPTKKKSLIIS